MYSFKNFDFLVPTTCSKSPSNMTVFVTIVVEPTMIDMTLVTITRTKVSVVVVVAVNLVMVLLVITAMTDTVL